ncbi:hypothetical protein [Actinophytocola sediminis]
MGADGGCGVVTLGVEVGREALETSFQPQKIVPRGCGQTGAPGVEKPVGDRFGDRGSAVTDLEDQGVVGGVVPQRLRTRCHRTLPLFNAPP